MFFSHEAGGGKGDTGGVPKGRGVPIKLILIG